MTNDKVPVGMNALMVQAFQIQIQIQTENGCFPRFQTEQSYCCSPVDPFKVK